MPTLLNTLRRLARDESGAETLEMAIICGLIVTAALGVCAMVGPKVLARWNSINSSVN